MPNWIEGTLKIRGKQENVKRFLLEGTEPCYNNENGVVEDALCIKANDNVWVKGTRRAFIDPFVLYFDDYDEEYNTYCVPVRQAWYFSADDWEKVAYKYEVDLRLYGFEQGMQFCQEVEVIDGEITIDEQYKFDDWDWECPMPRMGG